MQIGSSIRHGTLWLFTGSLGQYLFEFGFGIILARLLVPADFGLLITTQVFTGMAGFVAGGGMGQALIQSREISPKHFHVVFTLQFLICSLIYSIFYHGSTYIADWFHNPLYTDLLRVSALSFIIRPFLNISTAKLNREMRFKAIAIVRFSGMVITNLLSIYYAKQHFGVWSLVWGGLISSLLSTACFMLISRNFPKIAFDKILAKKMGGYGFKFTINDIFEYIKDQTPNFMLGKFLGPGDVGLFNKGYSLSIYPVNLIAGSAYQTVFRALSTTQDNLDKSRYIYLKTVTLVTVYTFPFYVGLYWLAEPLITIAYGDKWKAASIPLQLFCWARLLGCIGKPAGAVMAARNLLSTEIKIQFTSLLLAVGGCWYGIQQNSSLQVIYGMMPSFIFLYIALTYCATRAIQVSMKELLKALYPAFLLNCILVSVLLAAEYLLAQFPEIKLTPISYCLVMSGVGSLVYAILFLYTPIQTLETESTRWKKTLRLSPKTV